MKGACHFPCCQGPEWNGCRGPEWNAGGKSLRNGSGWGTFLVTLPDTDNLKFCRWIAAPGDTTTWEQTGRLMAKRGALGIEAVTARMKTTAARRAGRLRQHDRGSGLPRQNPVGPWRPGGRDAGDAEQPAGQPSRLRSFDPARVADLEYRAWVAYYRHEWHQALMAFVGLIRMGFGMDWCRTLYAAWLALRAIQLWAPLPDNDPDGARARMSCFYAPGQAQPWRAGQPGQGRRTRDRLVAGAPAGSVFDGAGSRRR